MGFPTVYDPKFKVKDLKYNVFAPLFTPAKDVHGNLRRNHLGHVLGSYGKNGDLHSLAIITLSREVRYKGSDGEIGYYTRATGRGVMNQDTDEDVPKNIRDFFTAEMEMGAEGTSIQRLEIKSGGAKDTKFSDDVLAIYQLPFDVHEHNGTLCCSELREYFFPASTSRYTTNAMKSSRQCKKDGTMKANQLWTKETSNHRKDC
jgi:hypothetical protein